MGGVLFDLESTLDIIRTEILLSSREYTVSFSRSPLPCFDTDNILCCVGRGGGREKCIH